MIDLLRSLREDGRTIPEFRSTIHPAPGGDVFRLALVDQDFIEQVEIPLREIEAADSDLVLQEAIRLVNRRKMLRAP